MSAPVSRARLGGADEIRRDAIHVVPRHLARHLVERVIGDRRGRDQRPVAVLKRHVHPFPADAGRSLAPAMAQLDRDLRIGFRVDEVDDPLPRGGVRVFVEPGAARCDPPFRADAEHLGEDQPGAAEREAPQVDEMEVADRAVPCRIHVHRRDDDPVGNRHPAQPERGEHRRPVGFHRQAGLADAAAEPGIDPVDEPRVPEPQIVVGHLFRARQHGERRLDRLHVPVPSRVLGPDHAGVGCVLGPLHLRTAVLLETRQRVRQRPAAAKRLVERDRVLHRELGPRPDRVVRGVERIAQQHHIVVPPALVPDHREGAPDAAVGDQPVAVEPVGPEALHVGEEITLGEIGDLSPGAFPGRGRGLDDPGAFAGAVLVGAEHPDPVLVGREVEGEGLVRPRRAEPEEAVAAVLDARPERLAVAFPDGRVDPVGADHQVEATERGGVADLAFEVEIYAEPGAAALQNVEQRAPRAAAEAVPAAAHGLAVEDEVDLVPVDEDVADRVVALRVVVAEIVERLVGEHDPEAERVVAPVALEDLDVPVGPGLLREQREVEPRRAAADHRDPHGGTASRPGRPGVRPSPP